MTSGHTHSSQAGSSHHHTHPHVHGSSAEPSVLLIRAIIITLVFMVVELIGGWYSNSLALISDSAHMLVDVGAMLLSLIAAWVAKRPSTLTMSFGYYRAEVLAALLSGLLVWVISGCLIYSAISRMQTPPEVQGSVLFVVASIGFVANLFSMHTLHSAQGHNLNIRAAYLHLLSDLLGSIGAILAGAILWLTGWRPIDPIMTILFSAAMLVSSWGLVKEAIQVLMESTPRHLDPAAIQQDLQAISGVQEVHDLHVWTVASGRSALSVHLISKNREEALLKAANQILKEKYQIIHTTIQIEHPDHFLSEHCYDCTGR